MMKRIAIALILAAGCKDGTPSSPPASAPAVEAPAIKARPAAPRPSLPDEAPISNQDPRRDRWKDRMAKMDTNGDGVVSDEERAAARKQRIQSMHDRFDTNGDGKLTPDELNDPNRRGPKFDNPAALDTNHDGEISTDELEAAMQARREEMRARRAAGSAADPTP